MSWAYRFISMERLLNLPVVRVWLIHGQCTRQAGVLAQRLRHASATVIGARPFLVAYNVNLNTRSKKLANAIALNIREAGKAKRSASGEIEKDAQGNTIKVPGTLKECRAVGWYVDEYERAQVSINLTNFEVTDIHDAFDEVERGTFNWCLRRRANQCGNSVTWSK